MQKPQPILTRLIQPRMSYILAASNNQAQPIPPATQPTKNITKFEEMVVRIIKQMESMLKPLISVVDK